jgi:hypothetical protein
LREKTGESRGSSRWVGLRRRTAGRVRSDESGVALVEFAIMLPLLATIVFGTVDLGRAYTTYEHMKNAAREGAYLAKTFPKCQWDDGLGTCPNPGDIWDRAVAESSSKASDLTLSVTVPPTTYTSGAGGTKGTLQTSTASSGVGTAITIKVTDNNFHLLTPFIQAFTGPVHISSTVTVREES